MFSRKMNTLKNIFPVQSELMKSVCVCVCVCVCVSQTGPQAVLL